MRAVSKSKAYAVIDGANWLGNVRVPSMVPAVADMPSPKPAVAAALKRMRNSYPTFTW
jgi:hypothetical protein